MLRLISVGMFAFLIQGCKDRGDSSSSELQIADSAAISGILDHEAPAGKGPSDVLSGNDRLALLFGSSCGVEGSKIKLFNPDKFQQGKWAWFEEKTARKWAAPSFRKKCVKGETYEGSDEFCWAAYRLQMFPVAISKLSDHYLVSGTSPIIRVFPEDSYPVAADACRFGNDTAFIFVAGVNNAYLGESWKTTDKELLAAILAWNRNRPEQATGSGGQIFAAKMHERPGYIQIVGNSNTKIGGVLGAHDEQAIETMIRNLELAYRSGVRHLEIASHSNGMITVQSAVAEFSRQLAIKGPSWLTERNGANPGVGKLELQLFHLQAAPSQKWSRHKLDKYENYSDFLPNARWEKKSSLGVPYWGWEWDFNAYAVLENYASMNIDYFYNAPDRWTFPWTSSVGRTVSIKWHEEVQNEAYKRGVRSTINHHVCEDKDIAVCGPTHSQKDALWDFANPGFAKNMKMIDWRTDVRSGPVSVGAAPFDTMQETAPQRQIRAKVRALPDILCLDVQVQPDQCKKIFARQDGVAESLGQSTIPEPICAAKDDQRSRCNSGSCGDGICSLGEAKLCPADCKVPDSYQSCSCIGDICNDRKIACNTGICEIQSVTPVSGCQCQDTSGVVKCAEGEVECEILKIGTECTKKMSEPAPVPGLIRGSLLYDGQMTQPRVFQKQ